MTRPSGGPRFTRSPLLVDLVAETERLAAAITNVPASERHELAPLRREEAARASLALDGADPLALPDLPTARETVLEEHPAPPREVDRRGTWLDAMGVLERPSDRHLMALEVLGVAAADASEELAPGLLRDPVPTLAELHRRVTRGLVAEDHAGTPRRSDQAVHDASTGRVIFFPVEPPRIPAELARLAAWLAGPGHNEHALIISGVLQHELLRIHPFEAANGRLARAAARLVLRARGLDPDGLAAPEVELDRDRGGYHDEVARTVRRRDLSVWLERWGFAVADGLRGSARRLGALAGAPPDRATAFVADHPSAGFTVADYTAAVGVDREASREDLTALLDAGLVERTPGGRGLRFTIVAR